MTAFDSERRHISESLHDGALQSVLAARQDVSDAARAAPDVRLERALSGLREVAQRLRELTFVLHPAVLEQVGLAEATKKVLSIAQSRSGIEITVDVDSSMADSTDPMVFGVLRELVSMWNGTLAPPMRESNSAPSTAGADSMSSTTESGPRPTFWCADSLRATSVSRRTETASKIHSTNRRRIASATAAPRSESPSFS